MQDASCPPLANRRVFPFTYHDPSGVGIVDIAGVLEHRCSGIAMPLNVIAVEDD